MIRFSRLMTGAVLFVGLLAAAAPTSRAAEPDKLIPPDADSVISVDLKMLMNADFVKKFAIDLVKKELEKEDTKQFLTDIGLDPLKDIEKLVLVSMETKFTPGAEQNILLIVRGTFDAEKLFKRAEAETKTKPEKYSMVKDGDTVMFKYQPAEGQPGILGNAPLFATVADEKTIVVATDKKYVTSALKAAEAAKPAPLRKEIADLIKKVDPKTPIYVATILSGKLADLPIPNQAGPINLEKLGKALPNAESLLVTVRVGVDLNIDVWIGMKDVETANDMRNAMIDLIDQVKPFAKLIVNFEPQAKAIPDLLDAIKITSKNKDMILTLTAPGNDIGAFLQIQPGARKKKKD